MCSPRSTEDLLKKHQPLSSPSTEDLLKKHQPPSSPQDRAPDLDPRDPLATSRVADGVPARELRAAVTMVGGVSLAIYENGVAQELFEMTEGRGVYGLLKRITHTHAYVDVLSGTSAGGINTIMLSAALCNRVELKHTREIWIKLAGIEDLLQDPKDTSVEALLRGNDYYLPTLEEAFRQITDQEGANNAPQNNAPQNKRRGIPSGLILIRDRTHYGDLDLFVTGTYYEGRPSTFFDQRNQPIFTEDHFGVFHFSHRPMRGESHFHADLRDPKPRIMIAAPPEGEPWPGAGPESLQRKKGIYCRLARVARASSSLPVVFETAVVPRTLMNGIIELPNRETNYFGDGGYLNNRPLNLVLEQIYKRPADREVVRKVFFVQPVAEPPRQPVDETTAQRAPKALEHALFALRVPAKQTLRNYLLSVHEHNRRAQRVADALTMARQMLHGAPPTDAQHNLWIELRLRTLRNGLIDLWERQLGLESFTGVGLARNLKKRAEAMRVIRDRLMALMLRHCIDWQGLPQDHFIENPFSLSEVDIDYLLRKIMRLEDEIYRALFDRWPQKPPLTPEIHQELGNLLRRVQFP